MPNWRCPMCKSLSKEKGEKAPKCQQKGCNYAVCLREEDTTGKVRNGKFTITDETLDVDLQQFDLTAKIDSAKAKQMLENGKTVALQLMNAKLKADEIRIEKDLTFDMFRNSGSLYKAMDDSTQHAEWKCEVKGKIKRRPPNDVEITATIDIDDIPVGAKVNGPDRPHVGWMLQYKELREKRTGHVFIDRAYVSRNGTPATQAAPEDGERAAEAAHY